MTNARMRFEDLVVSLDACLAGHAWTWQLVRDVLMSSCHFAEQTLAPLLQQPSLQAIAAYRMQQHADLRDSYWGAFWIRFAKE